MPATFNEFEESFLVRKMRERFPNLFQEVADEMQTEAAVNAKLSEFERSVPASEQRLAAMRETVERAKSLDFADIIFTTAEANQITITAAANLLFPHFLLKTEGDKIIALAEASLGLLKKEFEAFKKKNSKIISKIEADAAEFRKRQHAEILEEQSRAHALREENGQ